MQFVNITVPAKIVSTGSSTCPDNWYFKLKIWLNKNLIAPMNENCCNGISIIIVSSLFRGVFTKKNQNRTVLSNSMTRSVNRTMRKQTAQWCVPWYCFSYFFIDTTPNLYVTTSLSIPQHNMNKF